MTTEPKTTGRRVLTGIVVSDKMDKTVTVQVTRVVQHGKYGKYMHRTRTFKAHDEKNDCKVNDTVVIEESRPLSKTKRWTVIERRAGAIVTPVVE